MKAGGRPPTAGSCLLVFHHAHTTVAESSSGNLTRADHLLMTCEVQASMPGVLSERSALRRPDMGQTTWMIAATAISMDRRRNQRGISRICGTEF